MDTPDRSIALDTVRPGRAVTVVRVDGDDITAQRLRDLGVWPGVIIEVVRRAPFGEPTQYRLQGYRLALRRLEAHRVRVTAAP